MRYFMEQRLSNHGSGIVLDEVYGKLDPLILRETQAQSALSRVRFVSPIFEFVFFEKLPG